MTVTQVTVKVSAPAVKIAGGRSGMRPVGIVRDYRATVFGHEIHRTSKSEIKSYIRALAYRETGSNRVDFTFEDEAA